MNGQVTGGQRIQLSSLWGRGFVLVAGLLGTVACGSDATSPRDEQRGLLEVVINHRAVTLSTIAPHRTIQLSAVGYDGTGRAIEEAQPVFVSSDDNISVSPEGLVTALHAGTIPSLVIAKIQYEGVTKADSAYILVTDAVDPAPFQHLSLDIPPVVVGAGVQIVSTVQDANGETLNVPIDYRSSDPTVATVDTTGNVTGVSPDAPVTISATATVYGVTLIDTVHVIVGYPTVIAVSMKRTLSMSGEASYQFNLNDLYVSAGGTINFLNAIGSEPNYLFKIEITFDDPSAAVAAPPPFPTGDGNIPLFGATKPSEALLFMQRRVFPRPGTYTFYSETIKSGGRIHVR